MKRKQPIALKTGNRVIAWSKEHHRNLPVVVTRVNSGTFQGETTGKNPEKVNGLSKLQAWTLKEFEKQYPEEFYALYPHKRPQVEETVNSLQSEEDIDDNGNTINGHLPPVPELPAHDFKVGDRVIWQEGNFTVTQVNQHGINIMDADKYSVWVFDIEELKHNDSWSSSEFGELVFLAEPDGQLNLLEPLTNEPPEPDDFADLTQYEAAWAEWEKQNKPVKSSMDENYTEEENKPGVTNLRIDAIELLQEMQPRHKHLGMRNQLFCEMGVERSLERINNGEAMKAITVFRVGERLILTSGFHRIEASRRAGKTYIPAIIKEGTFEEARINAACSNRDNGIPLGDSDIGEAIRMFLKSLSEMGKDMSLRAIAKEIGCSHTQVANVKKRLEFEDRLAVNNIELSKRFKHKELGTLGEIFQIQWLSQGIIIEWDYGSPKFSNLIPIDEFIKDFVPTTLPKVKESEKPVNSVQSSFNSVESETKAKARSLGLPSSAKQVLPDCDDNGDGNCLNADRNTPPEMEPPTPEQCYSAPETIKINPADLVIGITSNVNLLNQEHCLKIWDAIADKLPDPIKVQDMTDNQLKAFVKQAKEELNKRNHPDYFKKSA